MSIQSLSRRLALAGVKHVIVTASSSEFDPYIDIISNVRVGHYGSPKTIRAIMAINPEYKAGDYQRLAVDAKRLVKTLEVEHSTVFDVAFEKTHGRKPNFGDFRVSGIGDDKLPEAVKNKLRNLSRRISALNSLYIVTFPKLARMRSLKTAKA